MAKMAVIKSGEKYFASCIANKKLITLNKFIFANVPYVNGNTAVNVNGGIPPASQIKHTASVTQAGLISDNAVVYSVVLDTTVGDFEFNYIGLMNAETNTLCMVLHTDLQQKLKTQGQQQGNTLTESLWLEIDGAAQATGITVNAETWMIDYSARMAGEDERIRLSNLDHYGRLAIHSGLNITYKTVYTIHPGIAYVAGLRIDHLSAISVVAQKGEGIYIDAWLSGTVTGAWSVNYKIVVGTNLTDYKDGIFQHYVERIATIGEPGAIQKPNIYSVVNSVNGESGAVKVTPQKIGAVSKSGDTMTGDLTIQQTDARFLLRSGNVGTIFKNESSGVFSISYYDGTSASVKAYYTPSSNTLNFVNLTNVFVNNNPVFTTAGGTLSSGITAPEITTANYGNLYKFTVNNNNTFSHYITGSNGLRSTRLRWFVDTNTWNFENSTVTINNTPVLINGSYGVGSIVRNLDNIDALPTENGFSIIATSTTGNKPFTGTALIQKRTAVSGSILAFSESSDRIAYRRFISSTAQPWKELITTANIDTYVASYPIGAPIDWFSDVMPDDGHTYLFMDGTAFDKTKYPKLAKVFPTGKLPDVRGLVRRGMDNGRGLDPNRVLCSYQEDAIRNITGSIRVSTRIKDIETGALFYQSKTGTSHQGTESDGSIIGFDASRVVPTATENRMKNIACHVITRAA